MKATSTVRRILSLCVEGRRPRQPVRHLNLHGLLPSLMVGALCLQTGCPSGSQSKEGPGTDAGKDSPNRSASLAWDPVQAGEQNIIPVKVAPVSRTTYSEFADFFADVDAAERVVLKATAGGTVGALKGEEGDKVRKGQDLCAIDDREAETHARIASIEERLAKEAFDRNSKHFASETISKVELDRSELAWLRARNASIQADKALESARCRAPFDGVIIRRFITLHDDLPPGAPTLEIAQLNEVKVTLGIPETDLSTYKKGTPVTITADGISGTTWNGKIDRIGETVDPQDRTIEVEVRIPNEKLLLKPGLTVRARVEKYHREQAIVLPNDAVLTHGKNRVVMIAEGDRALKRAVEVISTNETHTLVGEGVTEGELVIISGQAVVVDGSPIKVL